MVFVKGGLLVCFDFFLYVVKVFDECYFFVVGGGGVVKIGIVNVIVRNF